MEELKPCPFCGGKAKLYSGWDNGKALRKSYWASVKCTQCGIVGRNCYNKGPIEDIERLTIESWNRRENNVDKQFLVKVAEYVSELPYEMCELCPFFEKECAKESYQCFIHKTILDYFGVQQ